MSSYRKLLYSLCFLTFAIFCNVFVIFHIARADEISTEDVPLQFIEKVSSPGNADHVESGSGSDQEDPKDDPRESENSTILQGISDLLQSWNEQIVYELPENDNEDYGIMEVLEDDYRFNFTSGVAIYRITYSGSSATAVFPLASAESLSVTEDGILINTGTGNISGRLFTGAYHDSYSTGYAVTLLPVLSGNIFSQLYNNGHSAYISYYYTSNGRVQSSNTYYTLYCDDYTLLPPLNSVNGHSYFSDVIIILLLGGILICLFRRSWS